VLVDRLYLLEENHGSRRDFEAICEKIDFDMVEGSEKKAVEAMIQVCADLWADRPEQARKLEKAIVAIFS
jgi:hypothetical protein